MRLFHKTYRQKDPKTGKATGPRQKASTYTVRFKVAGKTIERATGCRDESAAAVKAAAFIKQAELKAAGIETHPEVRDLSLVDLVREHEVELRRRGRSEKHVRLVGARVRTLVKGASRLAQVTPEWIRKALGRLDLAPLTLNHYRANLHGFFAWLVLEQRWSANPVDAVPTVRVTGKTRERRALTDEEMGRLLTTAPVDRRLAYLLAASTGLRRGELAALAWGDVDLEAATVTVRAASAKNRKDAVLPLAEETVRALQAGRGAVTPVARVLDRVPAVSVLRRDLVAAGIDEETPEGVVDFHALRVTFITALARAGVSLAMAQKLARHSTPVLTANVYSRLQLDDKHAAVAKLTFGGKPKKMRRRRSAAKV